MQIRCYHCSKPFAVSREAVHTALDQLISQKLSHYDAACPHCRRVNRVARQELQHAAPEWKSTVAEEKADNG
jgi:phage FluMu protein Com